MSNVGDEGYEADIRWTTHGVAHIRSETWGGLGFGQGFALARDHLPTVADQIVKVRSERSRFHGAGPDGGHVASDLGYLVLGVVERAEQMRQAQAPHVRELVSGYVAGINAWLAEARDTDALPPWCADAAWIRPLDELDLYAYFGDLALLASGRNLVGIIGRAEAPGPDGPKPPSPLSALGANTEASNGWAFGRDATASGHGLVMANPHFPWSGEARFWECHLTLPGELDVYGASLIGAPGVQMGFNAHVGWAHTFSAGHRFTLARLDLVPGSPTSYRFGAEERDMIGNTWSVEVLGDDGATTTVERELWSSHHGPMVNLPLLGWGTEVGFTYRDANLDNTAVISQFLGMAQARGMDEFQRVFATVGALPWVNTLAADRTGRCWYTDASATPALSPDAQQRFRDRVRDDVVAALLAQNRVALLDGSDPGDEWVADVPGARSPGLEAPSDLPALERTDVVCNANDSHWLANPAEPLLGFSPLHGFERTPQTLRTRQNLRTVTRLAAQGDLTVESVLAEVWSNEGLSAELLRGDVVGRTAGAEPVEVQGIEVDVAAASAVLAAWDGRCDLGSRGAVLWRELMAGFPPAAFLDAGPLFAVGFDPDDPLDTPHTLAARPADGPDPIVTALANAVVALEAAGFGPDVSIGEAQWAARGDERVPVHGGGEGEGVANVLAPIGALSTHAIEPPVAWLDPIPGRTERTGLTAEGYRCTYGTSFLMSVELTDDGPVGIGLLAYGQSGDPRSPHHRDGTDAYAAKQARPLLFADDAIESDPNLERRTVSG
jgi:acyl-homoserine-lactone acylase